MAEAKRIVVEYDDGNVKEMEKGFAAEFDNDTMHMDMLNVSKVDIVRIAYGMLVTVDKMGMTSLLQAFASGEMLPDEIKIDGGKKMTVIKIQEDDGFYYECPVCGNDEIELGQNYCSDCGEAIEWKEDLE